ncbi:hypothetical protein SAMN05444678_1263 [Sphingomonas sp. YR710]|uniref:hypothetical protein n=1 Tax=Sphingomonas sp. YR710 TaxID=1882773 RepID=UPI00088D5FA7|nr:hypothetical protein [Sphingomonas sp. YR710]SDD84628.1 hypothetical protein SAMN05444678_1263 [Sphingomonas sp. YR710]
MAEGQQARKIDARLEAGLGRPKGHRSEMLVHWFSDIYPKAKPAPNFEQVQGKRGLLYAAIKNVVKQQTKVDINERTVQRALNGNVIESGTESRIASALAVIFPNDSPKNSSVSDSSWICGVWDVGYIEDDLNDPLHITRERAYCEADGNDYGGYYDCISYDRKYEFIFTLDVNVDCVCGRYLVRGRDGPVGTGLFQLISSRNREWLQGHCTWYDFDRTKIMSSPCIWYKSDAQYRGTYESDLTKILNAEIVLRS